MLQYSLTSRNGNERNEVLPKSSSRYFEKNHNQKIIFDSIKQKIIGDQPIDTKINSENITSKNNTTIAPTPPELTFKKPPLQYTKERERNPSKIKNLSVDK